jgi:hypothetical protein
LTFETIHRVNKEEEEEEEEEEVEEEEGEEEEDIACITRQIQNFLIKKQGNKKFSNFKKDGNKRESSKEELLCYN